MNWVYFFALQLVFFTIILGFGYAGSIRVERIIATSSMHWIDRICIAAVVVVLALGALGVVIALVPWSWRFFVGGLGALLLFFGSAFLIVKGRYWRDFSRASVSEKTFFGGYVLLCGLTLAMALFPAKLPAHLVDGPYVAKHDVLGVRIQYITGNLPTDNSIPHVVSEYLLRGISFKSERPIMPGQEVSNRPILASLVILPFRAAIDMPKKWQGTMPRFDYVGTSWPDFSLLMRDDRSYLVSLSIGIALNALLLLALGSFAVRIKGMSGWAAVGAVGLVLTSPYFLFQTMFTWPKELAAFFVLFAYVALQNMRAPILAGICLGLGYLSHPYAIVFLAANVIWMLANFIIIYWNRKVDGENALRSASQVLTLGFHMLGSFALMVMPWILWSKFFLDIPSDLVAQNFFQPGQRVIDFSWVRVVNVFNLILPIHLIVYPFDVMRIVSVSAVNICGAIGLSVFVFALHRMFVSFDPKSQAVYLINWLLPAVMLIFVFSNQAVPALHGLQGPIALILLIGMVNLFQLLSKRVALMLVSIQLGINVIILIFYFKRLA